MRYPCLSSLLESRLALRMKYSYEVQTRAYRISWEMKRHRPAKMEYYYSGTESMWYGNWNHFVCHRWKCEVDHPSQSTLVSLGKKQKWCSLWCPWYQVQQDPSGPDSCRTLGCLWTIHHRCTCKWDWTEMLFLSRWRQRLIKFASYEYRAMSARRRA